MRRYRLGRVIVLVGVLFLLFNILFLHNRDSFASLPLHPFWTIEPHSLFLSRGTPQLLSRPIVPHQRSDSLLVEQLTHYKRMHSLVETSA